MNLARLRIIWILYRGNFDSSTRQYWGWVSLRTAIAASAAWKRTMLGRS